MKVSRRTALSVTAAGLIHVAVNPQSLWSRELDPVDVLLRKAADRGHTDLGWLQSYHSLSFGNYYDQAHMGFRSLRVINDDRISAGHGFPTHPHRNMEIISYVLDGALQHKDSTGRGAIITAEDIQMMSAGTGITHSEFNPSDEQPTHLYQIWLLPERKGLVPSYEQKRFDDDGMDDQLRLVASPDGSEGSLTIHQDVKIYLSRLGANKSIDFAVPSGRHVWLQVLRGTIALNGDKMGTSDGAAISEESDLHIAATSGSEIMLLELA